MAYAKQLPIRLTLEKDACDFLLEALKDNENIFDGIFIAEDARALREKIEKYARHDTDENGVDVVHLGFYEREGAKFIWQFMAASKTVVSYRKDLGFTDNARDEINLDSPAETEV